MMKRAAGLALRILVAILVVAPLTAWSALALWFRLPAPEALRGAAAIVFAILGLATIVALFMRRSRSLIALAVFAVAFGRLARLVEHDQAAARWRLGARRRAADDGIDRGRYSDAFRRPRFRLADRQRLHRDMEQALLRPLEAEDARSLSRLLGRAGDGACHHELRLRERRVSRVVGRGSAREDRRSSRRSPTPSKTIRSSISPRPNAIRSGCARTCAARTCAFTASTRRPTRLARCCGNMSSSRRNSPHSRNGTIRSPRTARPSSSSWCRAAGSTLPFDWRLVVNGFLPGYLYDHNAVVTTMPLSELMERARVSPQAKAADQSPDFSRLIRVGVPSPWDTQPK